MFEENKNLLETYLLDCEVFYLPYAPNLYEKQKIYERRKEILSKLMENLEKEYRGD